MHHTVTIREENAAAALEVMSRFAVRSEVAGLPPADDVASRDQQGGRLLEHPAEAFAYYRKEGDRRRHLRGEAHGLARRNCRLPRRGGGP